MRQQASAREILEIARGVAMSRDFQGQYLSVPYMAAYGFGQASHTREGKLHSWSEPVKPDLQRAVYAKWDAEREATQVREHVATWG